MSDNPDPTTSTAPDLGEETPVVDRERVEELAREGAEWSAELLERLR